MIPSVAAFQGTARFELLDRLGQGGMGVVYAALDRDRNQRIALKTIHTITPDTLVRFKNEFRALQDLQHPNLVRLDELFEHAGTWFFTMELVEGTDLLRHVRPRGQRAADVTVTIDERPAASATDATTVLPVDVAAMPGRLRPLEPGPAADLDEARLRRVLPQIVRGLCALHDAGKVHRDVKPSNILVARDGRAVIVDFGLITDAASRAQGRAVGTVAYMAPEQITDAPVGPAADWYAVGCTLYYALVGRPPFQGAREDVLAAKLRGEVTPPGEIVIGLPADLEDLCMDLLRRKPQDRPDGPAILRRLGATPGAAPLPRRAAFVGRDLQLEALRRACDDARAGRAVAVLVHGESGVGKTALVERFLERVSAASTLVLAGRCYERESVPYKALDQVIDRLSGCLASMPREVVATLLPERVARAAEVFPTLRRVPAIDEAMVDAPRAADPFQSRVAVFDVLRELLARLCARRGVAIAIDDLQWADADSLALLAHLRQGPDAPPVLLCATVRTAPDDAGTLATLRARLGDDVRDLTVERLSRDAARELVETLVRTAGGGVVGAETVAAEGGGHPMFLEALVQHHLRHPGSHGPLRLDDVLRARAAELEPAAARVLELVCVAGAPITQEVCSDAAGVPFAEVGRVIAQLRAAHLVRTHGVRRRDAVEAYHDRVREAISARIEGDDRRSMHLRLGVALEASGAADAEVLAVHFAAAQDLATAARYAERAADRALAALAFDHAARLCRWALELDPSSANAPRLRIRLAEALAAAGRGHDAAEVYLAVAAGAPAAEQLELRRRAAEQLLISGRIDEGLEVLRTVLAAVDLEMPATPRRALARLLVNRARVRLRGGGLRYTIRADGTPPPETLTRIDTCWSAAMGLAIVDPIRGADFQTRHLLLALDAGDPVRIAGAIAAEAGFAATAGGPARARAERMVRAAEDLAAHVADPNALGYAAFAGGTVDYLCGRWASSRERCDRAAEIFRDRCTGVTWWIDTARYFAIECLAYGGDTAELIRRVPAMLADAEARGDLYAATNYQIGLPNLAWLLQDDVDGARRRAAEAVAAWSHQGFHIQHLAHDLALGHADLYEGDGRAAYRRVTGVWPAITGAIIFRVQLTRIATYQQRAKAALAAASALAPGSERRALIADARRCAAKIAREHMAWSDPMVSILRAGAAHLDGDALAARLELRHAIDGFDAAGMGALASAARLRLGALEGGAAGAALTEAARLAFEAGAVRRPDRLTAMLAPGF